jgi:hypothetical protein
MPFKKRLVVGFVVLCQSDSVLFLRLRTMDLESSPLVGEIVRFSSHGGA